MPEPADGFQKGGNPPRTSPRKPPWHLSHWRKKTFSWLRKRSFSGCLLTAARYRLPAHTLACLHNRNNKSSKRKSQVSPREILPLRGHQAIYGDICGCHNWEKLLALSRWVPECCTASHRAQTGPHRERPSPMSAVPRLGPYFKWVLENATVQWRLFLGTSPLPVSTAAMTQQAPGVPGSGMRPHDNRCWGQT